MNKISEVAVVALVAIVTSIGGYIYTKDTALLSITGTAVASYFAYKKGDEYDNPPPRDTDYHPSMPPNVPRRFPETPETPDPWR